MISVKEAIAAAKQWMQQVYAPEDIPELMLEEVDQTEDQKHWLITMGFRAPSGHQRVSETSEVAKPPLPQPRLERVPRAYKQLRVNAETGKVESMQIREPVEDL